MARIYCLLILLTFSYFSNANDFAEIRWQAFYPSENYSAINADGISFCESILSQYISIESQNRRVSRVGCRPFTEFNQGHYVIIAETMEGSFESQISGKNTATSVRRQYRCPPDAVWREASSLTLPCPEPPPPSCDSEGVVFEGLINRKSTLSPIVCRDGCTHLFAQSPQGLDCSFGGGVGLCYDTWYVSLTKTAQTCSGESPPNDFSPAPDTRNCPQCDCMKAGKTWGTVNGVGTCVPRGTAGSTPVTEPTKPRIEENTPAPTEENPEPQTERTESGGGSITFNNDGTVTEKTENPDGSTNSVTQSLDDFCKQNATRKECGGFGGRDNSFGGGCGSFTCDGDAVQCAIAKKQHQDRCDDLATNEVTLLGENIVNGVDDLPAPDPFSDGVVEVDLGQIDGSGFVGSQCLPDMTFTYGGKQITFPFSNLCQGFQTAGKIILAFAYLIAARIIFT